MRRRPTARGVTLVETMVVLAIVALVMGTSIATFRSLRRTTAKSAAARLGAAIRYTYDRAVTTGAYYRIVFDLSAQQYWAERSDERYYLVRHKEGAGGRERGVAPEDEDEARRREEEEQRARQPVATGIAAQLQPPPMPRRARFESFQDSNLPKVEMGDTKLRDLYTARQAEPYTEGKAYLYFFPDGHTERALLHVEDRDGDVFTLRVHPLTGRVELKMGDIAAGPELDVDDEGQAEAPR